MADVIGRAEVEIVPVANRGRFEAELRKQVEGPAAEAGKKAGQAVSKGLNDAIVATGAALAARQVGRFFSGTVDAALEFESAFAGVRKTVDASEEEFGRLEQSFIDLSKTIPASAAEISRVAEVAGQLGVQTPAIEEFTRTMIDLGESTNLSAEEAATALARFANIVQLPQTEIDRLGSTIVDLGNNFATTEREITEFGTRLAGAGQIAGLTSADILAIGTSLSSVGVEAEAGGTAVQKVLLSITEAVQAGNDDLDTFAATAGLSVEEFARLFREDASEAFALFVEGLGTQGNAAITTLNDLGLADQRLIRAFLSLANAGDVLRSSIELGNKAFEDNTALTTEAEKRYATNAARLEVLRNRFDATRIAIGGTVAQGLVPLLDVVTRINPAIIGVTAGVAGLAAASVAFVRLRSIFQDVNAQLAQMGRTGQIAGRALRGVGVAAGVAVGVDLLTRGLEALGDQIDQLRRGTPDLEGTAAAILDVVESGGGLEDVFGQARLAVDEFTGSLPGTFLSAAADQVDELANKIPLVGRAFETGLERARKHAQDLDLALTSLVGAVPADELTALFERIRSELGLSTEDAARFFDDFTRASLGAENQTRATGLAADGAAGAIDGTSAALDGVGTAAEEAIDPLQAITGEFESAEEAADAFGDAIDAAFGPLFRLADARREVQESIADLNKSLDREGRHLGENTRLGREQDALLQSIIESQAALTQELVATGEATPEEAFIKFNRRMRDLKEEFPGLREEINVYKDILKDEILAGFTTKVGADTSAATTEITRFIREQEARRIILTADVTGRAGGGTIAGRASGGTITAAQFGTTSRAGQPLLVGEAGRELFIPNQGGAIFRHTDTERILAALRQAQGGAVYNITVNEVASDPRATAENVAFRVGARGVR